MDVAIVGCGFVADYYMATLADHPGLRAVAGLDVSPQAAKRFGDHWKLPVFTDTDALLAGATFDMVLNLTNPDAHYEVSRLFLEAGKHVYSEKPFAMEFDDARALVDLAHARGLRIASAPCIHLSEAVQTMRREIEAGRIGKPLLVYAEMDDNIVAKTSFRNWRSASGAPWPYEDEFEIGVTLEHAGYSLASLMALFGPVSRVVAYAALAYPGKPVTPGKAEGADLSLAAIEFASGVVARLSCTNIAPRNHAIEIIGDKGVMRADDCWVYNTKISTRGYLQIRNRFMLTPWKRRAKHRPCGPSGRKSGAGAMDFARGPAELAHAIAENRPSLLMPDDFALHVNEVSLAIHHAFDADGPADYRPHTTFAPLPPVTRPII
jgi:predicted dehydrogenase